MDASIILSKKTLIYHADMILSCKSDIMIKDNIKNKQAKIRIPQLSSREAEVLIYLAEAGPSNIYQIQQRLGLSSYSTAHTAVKALEKGGLIRIQALEKSMKGVTAKVYGLTFSGLIYALTHGDAWNNLGDIVKAWRPVMPLPMAKFEHFVDYGLKNEAEKCYHYATLEVLKELRELSNILANLLGMEEQADKALEKSWESVEKKAKEVFCEKFLEYVLGTQLPENLVKWHKALRSDAELRTWAAETLEKKAERLHKWAKIVEKNLKIIESEQEPKWEEIKSQEIPMEISWQLKI